MTVTPLTLSIMFLLLIVIALQAMYISYQGQKIGRLEGQLGSMFGRIGSQMMDLTILRVALIFVGVLLFLTLCAAVATLLA